MTGTINTDFSANSYLLHKNMRREPRVKLPISLYLRRPINEPFYKREVQTENVSRQGARIFCDVKLEVGSLLEVSGLDGRFSAVAAVCYIRNRRGKGWSIGLNFLTKTGKWVIN